LDVSSFSFSAHYTGCFSKLARFKNSISFDKKRDFLMRIFAKCLETVGFSCPFKKIKKFDFKAKTFGRQWDSNLHVHIQKP
jgi:hypothetical protein